ncbi:hypothetical protein KBD08_03910 [Candidatus Babeliales bacterium]|nr:hypothetical protein [Candidatus Babeliales bacterium]
MQKYWYVIYSICLSFSYVTYTSQRSTIDPDAIIALWDTYELDMPNPKMILHVTDPMQNYIDICTKILRAIHTKIEHIETISNDQINHYKHIATTMIHFLTQEVPKHALGNILPPAREHIPVIDHARKILDAIHLELHKRAIAFQLQDATIKIMALEKTIRNITTLSSKALHESKKKLLLLKKFLLEHYTPTQIVAITKYDLVQKSDLLIATIDQELNDRSLISGIILEEPTSPISKKTRSNLTPGLSSSSSTPIVDELDIRSPIEIKTPRTPQQRSPSFTQTT